MHRGSMSPERVPITSPSSGVRPIEVSNERPPSTAHADAPLPRWSTIWLMSRTSAAEERAPLPARTNSCEVPWKP